MVEVPKHYPHKGRWMSPERIKETIEFLIASEEASGDYKVTKITLSQEVFDTINDFKVYFSKVRKYDLEVLEDSGDEYINLTKVSNEQQN